MSRYPDTSTGSLPTAGGASVSPSTNTTSSPCGPSGPRDPPLRRRRRRRLRLSPSSPPSATRGWRSPPCCRGGRSWRPPSVRAAGASSAGLLTRPSLAAAVTSSTTSVTASPLASPSEPARAPVDPTSSSHSAGGSSNGSAGAASTRSATAAELASPFGGDPFAAAGAVAARVGGAAASPLADADGALVDSRICTMMSDFLVRALAFTPSALAIAKSWSLSLDSRTDCSSASAATGTSSPVRDP